MNTHQQNHLNARREAEAMSMNAEALKKTVSEQDNKLREYAIQLERYLEMLNKERGKKQELEETVLKQVEETKAMMKLTTTNLADSVNKFTNSADPSKLSSTIDPGKRIVGGVSFDKNFSERLQIAQSLENSQVQT
jgi:hypothetical protein